jgi:hypothetical protein
MENLKAYKLEELKVGMWVYLYELDGIVNMPIALKKSTLDCSSGDIKGQIVYIGKDWLDKVNASEVLIVNNPFDFTDINQWYDGELGEL